MPLPYPRARVRRVEAGWDGTWPSTNTDLVAAAIRLATTRDAEGEPIRCPAEKGADGMVDICRSFLDKQTSRRGGRHRPHLILDLEARAAGDPTAGRTTDGFTLSRQTGLTGAMMRRPCLRQMERR
jgi:hypothetical protein